MGEATNKSMLLLPPNVAASDLFTNTEERSFSIMAAHATPNSFNLWHDLYS